MISLMSIAWAETRPVAELPGSMCMQCQAAGLPASGKLCHCCAPSAGQHHIPLGNTGSGPFALEAASCKHVKDPF